MKVNKRFLCVVSIGMSCLVIGCTTIRSAREAQDAVSGKGEEPSSSVTTVAKIDLKGCSLEQLVDFAMTNRPSVLSATLAVEDARLSLKEIAADAPIVSDTPWTAPHLSVSGGYNASSAGTHWDGDANFHTHGSASFGLSLDLLVYDFGRYDARAKAQAERILAAEQSLIAEGYSVFSEVCAAYFNFVQARSLLDVALTNRLDYAEQLERAEARLEAGEAHQLDVLRAKVDLAEAVQELVAASNEVATTGAQFMYVLGIDATRGTADTVLDMTPIPLGTAYRGFAPTTGGIDAAYSLARTNAPSIRVKRARLRAASSDVDYAVANLLPNVTASASLSWSDPLWFLSWGVSAVQSLFEGFRKTTAVDRAVVAMQTAAAEVDAAEHLLSAELEAALVVRDNAVVAFGASVASAVSANENLEMVKGQFSVGDASRIDLTAAVAQHSSALGDCIKTFYSSQKAEAALFSLLGTKPIFHEEKINRVEVLK